jgi:hypothetical protein
MSATVNKLDKIEAAIGDTLAPQVPGDFNATLDSLVSERGGPAAFSPSQLAAAASQEAQEQQEKPAAAVTARGDVPSGVGGRGLYLGSARPNGYRITGRSSP